MGERLLCKQEVVGSIPITSTTERAKLVSRCDSGALAPREHRLDGAERRSCRGAGLARSIGERKFAPELRLLRV